MIAVALVVPVVAYDVRYFVSRNSSGAASSAMAEDEPAEGTPAPADDAGRLAELARAALGAPPAAVPQPGPAQPALPPLVDPFAAQVTPQAPAQQGAAPPPQPAAPVPPAAIVTGILCGELPMAIIDGNIVGIGDPVGTDGWTVCKIERKFVTLTLNGATCKLLLAVPRRSHRED